MAAINESGDKGGDAELIKELKDVEQRIARDRADERIEENELRDIEAKLKEQRRVTVHVTHVGEIAKASFEESIEKTLQHTWDRSYKELDIARKDTDVFQTAGQHPKSLMGSLGLTLEQAMRDKVIEDTRFQIATEHGGA